MANIELSFVIPCLNEAKTIASCIWKAHKGALLSNLSDYEIVVVDNGSDDSSEYIARAEGAKVVRVTRRGYGVALLGGFSLASGKYILMGDADGSYDFSDISEFVRMLRGGYKLVMGSRIKGEIKNQAMPFLHRYLGTPLITIAANSLFGCNISDINCGLRAFDRESMLSLKLGTDGMEFAIEMVIRASVAKLTITEVPIKYYPDGRLRRSHLRAWRDGWRILRLIGRYFILHQI